jgi:UDP-2,3-diacylglucosamine pyrophosphatase LpxH
LNIAISQEPLMIERTLVLSDLHLGNGGSYDIFAGGAALPALLGEIAQRPTRVILNGDSIDFLLNEDPLLLEIPRAVEQAKKSVNFADTRAVLHGLGLVLAAGGEVIIRLGNHDAELALAEVQAVVRGGLGQPPEIAAKLQFERGEAPHILEQNGARILISHGEQSDKWNQLPYKTLPGPNGPESASADDFVYPPGSRLVKTLLNPLKVKYGMRFADLLKPDFQGAVLTALAVNPLAVRMVFQGSTLTLMWQLFRRSHGASTFADGDDGIEHGLSGAIHSAGLSVSELEAIAQALTGDDRNAGMFSDEADDALSSAKDKLGLAGLKLYASAHRTMVGDKGEHYFALEPDAGELGEAQRLASKYDVNAVLFGHTHAARFHADPQLTYVNTGTWIWLMQLPPASASDAEWAKFLDLCRRNPRLDPTKGESVPLLARFNGALIESHPQGGARLSLVEWQPGKGLVTQKEQRVPAHDRAVGQK